MSFYLGEIMAKRSRRARRQETEKRLQQQAAPKVSAEPVEEIPETPVSPEPVAPAAAAGPTPRKTVNFAEEYYYVYSELRNIAIIAVLMFALMFGLGFFI